MPGTATVRWRCTVLEEALPQDRRSRRKPRSVGLTQRVDPVQEFLGMEDGVWCVEAKRVEDCVLGCWNGMGVEGIVQ